MSFLSLRPRPRLGRCCAGSRLYPRGLGDTWCSPSQQALSSVLAHPCHGQPGVCPGIGPCVPLLGQLWVPWPPPGRGFGPCPRPISAACTVGLT